jgi:hypothetical protein
MQFIYLLVILGLTASCNKDMSSKGKGAVDVKIVDSSVVVTWNSKDNQSIETSDLIAGHSLNIPNLINADGSVAVYGDVLLCAPVGSCLVQSATALTSDTPCTEAGCGDAVAYKTRYALPSDPQKASHVLAILKTITEPQCDAGDSCLKRSEDLSIEYTPKQALALSEERKTTMRRIPIKASNFGRSDSGSTNDPGKGN